MKCIKEFLKLNWWKAGAFVIITVLSAIVTILIYDDSFRCPDCLANYYGFPLPFYRLAGIGGIMGAPYPASFNPITFLLNLIIFYLLACLIYFIVTKIKNLIIKPK